MYNMGMSKRDKTFARIMKGGSDTNVPFDTTRTVLRSLGFAETVVGSHHKFHKTGVVEIIDLQPDKGGKCKPYQVEQMRKVLRKYGLA